VTTLEIRPASQDELDLVEGLLTGATQWLASIGSDQWQFPPHRERLLESMSRGECFLAYRDGRPVGTLTVDEHADPEFWQSEDDPSSAMYVHRMAVARDVAGQAVGSKLLDWAVARAAAAGKPLLRLDAWKTNKALQQYYLGQGFTLVRLVDLPHRGSGALFQRLTR
jgi:GNAT superfamily N-acetyltransferase